MKISIVVLTFNRRNCLKRQLQFFQRIIRGEKDLEIIIVDNGSDQSVDDLVMSDSRVRVVKNEKNMGAVGRNRGMKVALGDIIITLDDDVYGITDEHLTTLEELFESPDVAAVNFQILEEGTNRIANWCHPCDEEIFNDREFETSGISEGAVAFRGSVLRQVGYYPEYFFISHEGPDLAYRIINESWRILYTPEITVTHAYEKVGRPSWRRYYYDTRNQLWLVLRNYPFFYGVKKLFIGWCSMLVYSVRDGYFTFWLKAVFSSFCGVPRALRDRCPPTKETERRIRLIEKNKIGFLKMVRKRLFGKDVKI